MVTITGDRGAKLVESELEKFNMYDPGIVPHGTPIINPKGCISEVGSVYDAKSVTYILSETDIVVTHGARAMLELDLIT